MKRLLEIQQTLNAPKNKYNSFGEYYYRSCECILEAVKPLLGKVECILSLSDEVIERNGKTYIEATANFKDGKTGALIESVKASARESEEKKKMDDSQMTGTASSYARKYALNGLFLIDDNKDADCDEFTKQNQDKTNFTEKAVSEFKERNNLPVYNKSLSNMENGKKETKVEAKTKVTL